jgi:hypothetical protein
VPRQRPRADRDSVRVQPRPWAGGDRSPARSWRRPVPDSVRGQTAEAACHVNVCMTCSTYPRKTTLGLPDETGLVEEMACSARARQPRQGGLRTGGAARRAPARPARSQGCRRLPPGLATRQVTLLAVDPHRRGSVGGGGRDGERRRPGAPCSSSSGSGPLRATNGGLRRGRGSPCWRPCR